MKATFKCCEKQGYYKCEFELGYIIAIVGGRLMDVARRLDKADREALGRCADHLKRMHQYAYAAEIYSKMADTRALVLLHINAHHWDDVSQSDLS